MLISPAADFVRGPLINSGGAAIRAVSAPLRAPAGQLELYNSIGESVVTIDNDPALIACSSQCVPTQSAVVEYVAAHSAFPPGPERIATDAVAHTLSLYTGDEARLVCSNPDAVDGHIITALGAIECQGNLAVMADTNVFGRLDVGSEVAATGTISSQNDVIAGNGMSSRSLRLSSATSSVTVTAADAEYGLVLNTPASVRIATAAPYIQMRNSTLEHRILSLADRMAIQTGSTRMLETIGTTSVRVPLATASSDQSTGCITASGGVGIQGTLHTGATTLHGVGTVELSAPAAEQLHVAGSIVAEAAILPSLTLRTTNGSTSVIQDSFGNLILLPDVALQCYRQANFQATTESISQATGSIVSAGGIGAAGAINAGARVVIHNSGFAGELAVTATGAVALSNNNGYALYVHGDRTIALLAGVPSSSRGTGTLMVSGGVGVSEAVYCQMLYLETASAAQGLVLSATGDLVLAAPVWKTVTAFALLRQDAGGTNVSYTAVGASLAYGWEFTKDVRYLNGNFTVGSDVAATTPFTMRLHMVSSAPLAANTYWELQMITTPPGSAGNMLAPVVQTFTVPTPTVAYANTLVAFAGYASDAYLPCTVLMFRLGRVGSNPVDTFNASIWLTGLDICYQSDKVQGLRVPPTS